MVGWEYYVEIARLYIIGLFVVFRRVDGVLKFKMKTG